jgi:hypothetical protein
MVPDDALERLLAKRPDIHAELVEDVNHYTILMGDGASRVASAIMRAIASA